MAVVSCGRKEVRVDRSSILLLCGSFSAPCYVCQPGDDLEAASCPQETQNKGNMIFLSLSPRTRQTHKHTPSTTEKGTSSTKPYIGILFMDNVVMNRIVIEL